MKYKKVLGPLPPPGSGCRLAELDLEIKDEFQGEAIRRKCWPMPEADVLEIEKQVQELVDAGFVEPFQNTVLQLFWSRKRKAKPEGWWVSMSN